MTRLPPFSRSTGKGSRRMKIKGITDEGFVNYKVPYMFISTSKCSFKCEKESGVSCCQNSHLARGTTYDVDDAELIVRYLADPITKAIVLGGLEPFDQWSELWNFIARLRLEYECKDDVVIYTGYNRDEIEGECMMLMQFPNIVVKFGRYKPNMKPVFDKVLGVTLASENQYAVRIS